CAYHRAAPDRRRSNADAGARQRKRGLLVLRFIFTMRFVGLLAMGLALLSLGWIDHDILYFTILFDAGVCLAAIADYFVSENEVAFRLARTVEDRFAMGAENEVAVRITNRSNRKVTFILKDEYPAQMDLAEPREAKLTVTPNRSRTWRYRVIPTARGSYEF